MTQDFANQPRQPRRSGRLGAILLASLVAFGLGAGGMVAVGLHYGVNPLRLSVKSASGAITLTPAALTPPTNAQPILPQPAPLTAPVAALAQAQGGLEMRVAGLEQRLARLDVQAAQAQDNTAHAEALLIAFAARRVIERGAPLGSLEDQLKTRFGNSQPNAVATIIAAAHHPITLDRLAAQLESMGPALAQSPAEESAWARAKREFSTLFVFRHEATTPSPEPSARLDHARFALREGRINDAIADVGRLPGAPMAQGWIANARSYGDVMRALDLIETTALAEPHGAAAPVPTTPGTNAAH